MDARSESHVVALEDYQGVDQGWADEFFTQLSEDFEEVELLEDGQYKARTTAGSSARINYELERFQDDTELSVEVYGAQSAVTRLTNYLESEFGKNRAVVRE